MCLLSNLEQQNEELIKKLIILEELQRKLKKELLEKQSKIAPFSNIATPLVARVFLELVVNDIVGVQPMSTPTGLAYALKYRYQP